MSLAPTIIDLMRHGEPEGGQCYRGALDPPLTTLGLQQMQAQVPEHIDWQQILTSPLKRCADFAEQLCRETGLSLAYVPALREISFGDWEGKTAEQLTQENQAAFFAFYDDPVRNTPPNAESLLLFQQRVLAAWQQVIKCYAHRRILITTHGGTIRIILASILQQPLDRLFEIDVPYASIHRIQVDGEQIRLMSSASSLHR